MRMFRLAAFALFFVGILFMASWMFSERDDDNAVPGIVYGPIDAEGVLTSTGISLVRRGTHVLVVDGASKFYLESTSVHLREYDGRHVRVQGVLESNASARFLPVITVAGIGLADGEGEDEEVHVPALGIALSLPSRWDSAIDAGRLLVRRDATSADPFFTVERDASVSQDDIVGAPLRIAGRAGVRLDDERTGAKTVYLFDDAGTLVFRFLVLDDHPDLSAEFFRVLLSLRFLNERGTSDGDMPRTGTGAPLLCGGPAGILCPSGYYCNVTDFTMNTGTCRELR